MSDWVSKKKINFRLIIICIILCILAGSSGSLFTIEKIQTWYASLNKPWFTPPNWLFLPVWFTLFTLMGVSLYLVLSKGYERKDIRQASAIFTFQFALNILWSLIFFGLESPLFGFIEIIILWISIAATIWKFHGISRKAAYLLIPYICWVSVAAALNFGVLILN